MRVIAFSILTPCYFLKAGLLVEVHAVAAHIIDQTQYTILVTAVIGSAVVPTLIAQRWFQPAFKSMEEPALPPPPAVPELDAAPVRD